MVRTISQVTHCETAVIPFTTTTRGEVVLFASFASYEPQFISKGLPTVEQLDKFKECLFIDRDPDWHGF